MIEPYSKYHYFQLNEDERALYVKIADGWTQLQQNIPLGQCGGGVNCKRIVESVLRDYPELFYVDTAALRLSLRGKAGMTLYAGFRYPTAEIIRLRDALEKRVREITQGVAGSFEERIAALQKRLFRNLRYNREAGFERYTAVGALINGEAVCEGISFAFKLLCDAMRIPAIKVIGTGVHGNKEEPHSWNIVRDEAAGRSYQVDVTYNLGMPRQFDTLYLLTSDALIGRNHRYDRSFYPRCRYTGAYEKLTETIGCEQQLTAALKRGRTALLQFSDAFRPSGKEAFDHLIRRCVDSADHISPFTYAFIESMGCAVIAPA